METEPIQNPEDNQEKEPTVDDIISICAQQLGEEVRIDFAGLDFDEALGYAYTLLLENGIDPDGLFEEKGII